MITCPQVIELQSCIHGDARPLLVSTADRHSSVCKQVHRRGLQMAEGNEGPLPWWGCPTGCSAHHPQDWLPQRSRSFNPEQDLREDADLQVSTSSHRRCQHQGAHFYSHGILSEDGWLLGRDGIHMTKCSKGVFANGLASLLRRYLNQEWWGREIAGDS